jgi:hypothetical protein
MNLNKIIRTFVALYGLNSALGVPNDIKTSENSFSGNSNEKLFH